MLDKSEILQETQKILQSEKSTLEKLDVILEKCLEYFGANSGSISLRDPKENVLTIIAAKGMNSEQKIAAKLPFGVGITGFAAEKKESVNVGDVTKDKRYVKLIPTVASELAIPLIAENEVLGVLNLESKELNHFNGEREREAVLFSTQFALLLFEQKVTKFIPSTTPDPVEQILGFDPQILFLKDRIRSIKDSKQSVLITGESGCGKSVIAKTIHNVSSRKKFPFIEISIGAYQTENELELQLFGYTDGQKEIESAFERADGGTLFLKNLSTLPFRLQNKLLKVLQEGQISKPSFRSIPFNVRILSSTERDIIQDLEKDTFSIDLYYKLAEIPLRVPPLRERRADIPLLAHYFLLYFNSQFQKSKSFGGEALKALSQYPWPQNVRELESIVQYAAITSAEDTIPASTIVDRLGAKDTKLGVETTITSDGFGIISPTENLSLRIATERLESIWIQEAFSKVHTQEEVAKVLGISRGALQYKIKNNRFLADLNKDN